jgi:hypothetical protein
VARAYALAFPCQKHVLELHHPELVKSSVGSLARHGGLDATTVWPLFEELGILLGFRRFHENAATTP